MEKSSGGIVTTSFPSSPNDVGDKCNRREPLLSPSPPVDIAGMSPEKNAWRLDLNDFRLPERNENDVARCANITTFAFRRLFRTPSTCYFVVFIPWYLSSCHAYDQELVMHRRVHYLSSDYVFYFYFWIIKLINCPSSGWLDFTLPILMLF